jgi:hypothetical protein
MPIKKLKTASKKIPDGMLISSKILAIVYIYAGLAKLTLIG